MNVAKVADEFLTTLEAYANARNAYIEVHRECVWHESYAVFQLRLTWGGDEKATQELVRKTFPGCKVTYRDGCFEYEIEGPGCSEFFKKHSEEIEKLSESPEWRIFEP
jgi:hypothetical protein